MRIVNDFSNDGFKPMAGCVCSAHHNNKTEVRGAWDPIIRCKRSCYGEDNRDANKYCAKHETYKGKGE